MTPYRKGKVLAIALGHGKTDWVKNVLAAGEADVHFDSRDLTSSTHGSCRQRRRRRLPLMARVQAKKWPSSSPISLDP